MLRRGLGHKPIEYDAARLASLLSDWLSSNMPVHDHSSSLEGGDDLHALEEVEFNDAALLTIATGIITRSQVYHQVDTEAAGATDDLDTISGGAEGDLLIIRAADSAHTVVVRHGTGNIRFTSANSYTLDDDTDHVALVFDGTDWCDIGGTGATVVGHALLSATHTDTLAAAVVQGDLNVGNATPAWARLAVGADGAALYSDGTDVTWTLTPTWRGIHTHAANVTLDDGAGNSPALRFIGGSNDDLIRVFLSDNAVAGDSDLIIRLCAADAGSRLTIWDSTPTTVAYIDAAGNADFDGHLSIGGDLTFAGAGTGIIHTDGVTDGQFLRANGTRYVPDTLDIADLTDLAYATPALSFGVANAAGVADTVIRSDATLAIFDATVPDVIQCDDTAAAGTAGVAARRDHTHGIVCAAPAADSVNVAASAEGTATSFARSDHAHNLDEGIAPTWTALHIFAAGIDLNGFADALILDADGDTTISAPIDDQVDFEIAGANDFTITANSFNILAGSAIVMADGTTIGQAAGPLLTFDDTLNYLEITGCNVGVATAVPNNFLCIGGAMPAALASVDATLGVVGGTIGRVFQEGSTQADTIWYDSGGIATYEAVQFVNAGGISKFAILNDATWAVSIDNVLAIDMDTGNVGKGTAAPDHPLEVLGTGDAPMVAGTPAGQFAITPANLMLAFGAKEDGDDYTWIQAADRVTGSAYYPLAINPNSGNVIIGAVTASTFMGRGLTINQVTSDDEAQCWKSTDVGHPITDWADANTFGAVQKSESTSGGLSLVGYKDADGAAGWAAILAGRLGEAADTTKSAAGAGVVSLDAAVTDGAASHEGVGADGNLVTIRSSSSTRFIFDAEGEMHSDAIIGVGDDWDEWDDLALAADLSRLPAAKFDEMLRYHAEDFERAGLVTLSVDEEGRQHAFVKHKAMLLFGMCCFREIHRRLQRHERALMALGG